MAQNLSQLKLAFLAGTIAYGVFYLVSFLCARSKALKADEKLALEHGCKHPPELGKRWPLGLDRLKEIWQASSDGRLLKFFCGVARTYAPLNNTCQFFLFGPRTFHILDPRNVSAILTSNFADYGFGARASVFAPLIGAGIFTQEGAAWKHSRELLRKQFAQAHYRDLGQFREHVDNLIACIPNHGVVDLQPLFFNFTLDTATALLFGRSVHSLRAGIDQEGKNKEFADNFNAAQEGLAKRFRLIPFHSLYLPSWFRKSCRNVHHFVEQYISEREGSEKDGMSEGPTFFMDQILKESSNKAAVRDQLLNILLAGRDTTACCLSWTFRLLVRHDNVMRRLRTEVDSVMGDGIEPSREKISRMPYLASVVKESLRLYPPVPLNIREATKTTILPVGGGEDGQSPILVRPGEVCIFSQYITSRQENIFGADAGLFKPERWADEGSSSLEPAFFAFNSGPRRCLGEDFALTEIYYTIVRLLRAFPIVTLPDDEVFEPVGAERQRLTLVLASEDGCRVNIMKS